MHRYGVEGEPDDTSFVTILIIVHRIEEVDDNNATSCERYTSKCSLCDEDIECFCNALSKNISLPCKRKDEFYQGYLQLINDSDRKQIYALYIF